VALRRPRLATWVAVSLICGLIAAALAGFAPAGGDALLTVRVDARDFSFKLSRRSVPAGSTVRFVVRNRGQTRHDFVVKGRRTRQLRPGGTQTMTVKFPRKGSYRFLCSVSGHARLGMKGTLSVGKAAAPKPPPPAPITVSGSAVLTRIGTFERPILATAPPGDPRLFVVEQAGTIRIVRADGTVAPRPFLDIRDRVQLRNEPGLLGLAFAPDYATSGLAYVFYNARSGSGDLVLAEYQRDSADPDILNPYLWRTVLTIVKPWENHNGGMIQFGPDGHLYISVGDGDSGVLYPQGFFAQRRDELLGDVLRIDPRRGDPYAVPADNPFVGVVGVRPEIWAYGLRNPWRFWIDHETGAMFIGDAGNARREEVDLVPRGASGLNFGWPCFEGVLPFDTVETCDQPVAPLLEVVRENGVCAIIGGPVSRDPRLPALEGRYLYGDHCLGKVTVVAVANGRVTASEDLGLLVPQITSFGVDDARRIYVMALDGPLYRLDPKPAQ
jgi:glucose/arabinose dehydrogenase